MHGLQNVNEKPAQEQSKNPANDNDPIPITLSTEAARQEGGNDDADPFDISKLRMSDDTLLTAATSSVVATVRVAKPDKARFIRVHPGDSYSLAVKLLEGQDGQEFYLVDKSLEPELAEEPTVSTRLLVTCLTRQGEVFLWPLRLPHPDGREDTWSRSALVAAKRARMKWIRVISSWPNKKYEMREAAEYDEEPEWLVPPFEELLKKAFAGKRITDVSHPKIRELRGEK